MVSALTDVILALTTIPFLFYSEGSVYRRRKIFGLHASRVTTKELDEALKQELILEQIRKDGTGKIGARTVKIRIFQERGIHLTRCAACYFFLP